MDQENNMKEEPNAKSLSWRSEKEDDDDVPKRPRSHGIVSARTCYSTPREGKHIVHKLKADIRDRSIQMKKKRIGSAQETKLQAFKQVTAYKTWPVQEQALEHRRALMRAYLHDDKVERNSQDDPEQLSIAKEDSISATSSSSSSSSSAESSVVEPKRVLRDPLLSPAQSRVKCQYQREFLQEFRLPKPQSTTCSSLFAPALWCMEPRIFSYERNASGKRSYVVAHFGRFVDKYWRKTDPRTRHYYEVIPEHTPCRLYLDLEFSKACNESVSDEHVAEELMTELFDELQVEFQTVHQLQLDRRHVVDLDSSTDSKFSRHWILHLPGDCLFADNIAVGSFVKNFVSRLSNEQATRQLAIKGRNLLQDYLFVKSANKTGPMTTCMIDLGVYTRNRLFRLLGSQKFGKPPLAALRIAEANQFPFPHGFDNKAFFLPTMQESLSSRGSTEQSADSDDSFDFGEAMDQAVEKFVGMTDWSVHADALALTLVVPMNSSKVACPVLARDDDCESETKGKPPSHGRSNRNAASLSVGSSPYPMIDDFVEKVLALRGDVRGSIRAWSVDRDDNGVARQITYQMSRNRYCECVGRSHKSNNISWTVHFQSFCCTQGCHDPECRRINFRGMPVELPEDVQEGLRELLFDEALACVDEAELMKTAIRESTPEIITADARDLSFEQALASLNLDDFTQPVDRTCTIDSSESPTAISDDALMHAMLTNPELFP